MKLLQVKLSFAHVAEFLMELKVLELKFNEPKIKVLNLKLIYNGTEIWRTGIDFYFLYKLHLTQFPRSLRPSFPTALLDFNFPIISDNFSEEEYFKRLKDRLEYFFESFLKVCGVELQLLKEFHDFIDPSIEIIEFPKELDTAERNILPVTEWFPATSRFIRSSISRIRQRSPSPHLDLDAVEIKVNSFEDEKRLALQRIRLSDLEPTRTDLITLKVESNDLELDSLFKETREFDQRKDLLEKSLKSVSYLLNSLKGCKSFIREINCIFEDETKFNMKEFVGEEIIEKNYEIKKEIDVKIDKIEDFIKYPLQVQIDDVYSLTRGLNERIFSLKALDTSLIERQKSCDQLVQIQVEAIEAMDRAQGSLVNLTTSSMTFDKKIAAKNAEIEKKIKRVQECLKDFSSIDKHISGQLENWEIISDTFLLDKFKQIL